MKVLHLIFAVSPKLGGPFHSLGAFIAAGREVGIESEVLTMGLDSDTPEGWATGVPVHFARSFPRRGYPLSLGLCRHLMRGSYDVLHVHGLWRFPGPAAAWASRRRRVPLVLRTCGHLAPRTVARHRLRKYLYFALIEKHVLRRASLLHFTAEQERDAAREVARIGESVVIPPAVVAPPLQTKETARRRLSINTEAHLLVSVARLDPIKRHDIIIRALGRLPADTMLALVGGDGGAESYLRRLVEEQGLGERVRFAGTADRERVGCWLSAADVFVSASEHENFGVSIAEAATCGLPVVAPGDLYIARELQPHLVGSARTPDAIAGAVAALFAEGSLHARGEGLRQYALSSWSAKAIGARLLEAYRSAIASCSTGRISRTRSVS